MKKLKFWATLAVFGMACLFLPFGLIDSGIWQTIAITCLSIFSATHAATDITAILKTGGNK